MKRTGGSLKGVTVIDVLTGKTLGLVYDLLLELKEMTLFGIVAVKGRLFQRQRVIPFQQLLGVGRDAIMLEYKVEDFHGEVEYRRFTHYIGHGMITVSGDYFGKLLDILVDLTTGKITDYLFYPVNGKGEIPFMLSSQNIHLLGEDMIIVSKESPQQVRPYQEEGKGSNLPLWQELKDELGDLKEKMKTIRPKSLKGLTGMMKGEEVAEEIFIEGKDLQGIRLAKGILDEGGQIIAKKGAPLTRELVRELISLNMIPELLESLGE